MLRRFDTHSARLTILHNAIHNGVYARYSLRIVSPSASHSRTAVLSYGIDPEATPKYFSCSLVGNLARFSRLASFFEIVCIGQRNGTPDGTSEL